MAKGRGKQKKNEEREDEGRGEASRQSRRVQGLPAEEHKDLDQLNRERRARLKAEREALAAPAEEPAAEPAAQDEQVSTEAAEEAEVCSEVKVERPPEERVQANESAQASEGGANVVESPAVDRVSDSPPPVQEVESKAVATTEPEPKDKMRSASENPTVFSRPSLRSSNLPATSPQVQEPEREALRTSDAPKVVSPPETLNADLRSDARVETQDSQIAVEEAQNFVARQVYRWEQMRSGRVIPPHVEYAWPTPLPDFSSWFEAAKATSSYLQDRMSLENQDAAWIAELQPERSGFGFAEDLTAVCILLTPLTARECVAVLETMLFEAGINFVNVVPEWFATHASKVNPAYVRSVVEELQQLLSIELIEWKQLVAGVPHRLIPILNAPAVDNASQAEDATSAVKVAEPERDEDQAEEGDHSMSDYEIELLGRAFVMQCRTAGVMDLHSPRGKPDGQPHPKRPQRRPARPLSVSTPSEHSLALSSNANLSVDSRPLNLNAPSEDRSGSFRSMVGPSGSSQDSPFEASSGAQTSRNSSSSSSMMSMGHSASVHMPYMNPTARVMSVQSAGGLAVGVDFGGVLTQTVTSPPVEAPYEADVEMEPERADETRSHRTAFKERSSISASRAEGRESAFSESSKSASNARHSSVSSRHDTRTRTSGHSKSSRSSRSHRSCSHSSASSGAAQVALNLMRQHQQAVAELQANQEAFQDRQHKAQLEFAIEIHSLKEEMNRAKEAKAQADAALAQAEQARMAAERRGQAAEEQLRASSMKTAFKVEDLNAYVAETTRLERDRLQAEADEAMRLERQRLQSEAEEVLRREREQDRAKLERRLAEERVGSGVSDAARTGLVEQEINARLEKERQERERERDAAVSRQTFLAAQVRELRTTLAQMQAVRATAPPDSATKSKPEQSPDPQRATLDAQSSGVIKDDRPGYANLKNMTEVGAAQLDATVGAGAARWKAAAQSQTATGTKTETPTKVPSVKAESATRAKTESASKDSKKSAAKKSATKKPAPRKTPPRKEEKEDVDPPSSGPDDSDPDSPSSSDHDSSDSSDSWSDDSDHDQNVPTKFKDGTSTWTYRPFISYNAVEKFNEDAPLEDRVGWWERFMDIAAQGGWSHKWRIRQLRGRMSAPLRDWYAQLPKSTRHDWKKLSHRFRHIYCRTTGSYAERYYTMKMRSGETALKFFYRLNAAAAKADMDVQKTSKRREQHVRRFIKKLKDTQLKTALQGQRFKSLSDVEHALRRHEDVWREEGYDTPSPKRDFRADNDPRGRFKPRRSGRAFVAQDAEHDDDAEPELHVRFQEPDEEEKPPVPSALVAAAKTRSQQSESDVQPARTTQDLVDVIYRVMEAGGWRPGVNNPNVRSGPMSPRSGNQPWGSTCDNCGKPGHDKENCWKDLTCERCGWKGHPTQSCRAQPCDKCDRFHRGISCEDWDSFLMVKTLAAAQGSFKEVLDYVAKQLRDGEADSRKKSLNH